MHLEWRLWSFTEGFRAEIFFSTILGLVSSAFGVARLAMLGWLLGLLFKGESVSELIWLIVLMILKTLIFKVCWLLKKTIINPMLKIHR